MLVRFSTQRPHWAAGKILPYGLVGTFDYCTSLGHPTRTARSLKNGKVVGSLKKGNIETTWRSEVGGPFFGAQVAFDQMKQILLWQLQLKKTIAVGKLPIASFFLCL